MTDLEFVCICEKCNTELDITSFNDDLDICINCQLASIQIKNETKNILSIDIGIKHLAMTLISLDKNYKFLEFIWMDLIDITVFHCLPNCNLHHTKTFSDWINHVLYRYQEIFDKADNILIERQPPSGLVAVEQIIFNAWRNKAILISPNSVHKYFHMNSLDYDKRKEIANKIASKYIPINFAEHLERYSRKHDISDTVLFTLFWSHKMQEEQQRQKLLDRRKRALEKHNKGLGRSLKDFFDAYRYIPSGALQL